MANDLVHTLTALDDAGGIIAEIRSTDGYVNATKMCKSAGKLWSNYRQNKDAENFVETLVSTLGVSKDGLIVQGSGSNKMRHTWVHPEIAKDLLRWINKICNSQHELNVRNRIAKEVHGTCEVKTPHGPIDVLSDTEVIEVKHITNYLHGLGQVLGYGVSFPEKKKRLHLFGSTESRIKYLDLAKEICQLYSVKVTFEEIQV